MRFRKVFLPLLAITAMGFAGAAATGCHAEADAKVGGATPPPPPPPPEPPPPASTAVEAPPPPPPPAKKVITLKGVQMKSASKIDMPGDIEYQSGSAKIVMNDKSKKVLTQVATILKDNSEITKLRIEGNTDNAGEDKGFDNTKLSTQRAQSIADYLTKNGVDASRLVVVGYGSSHPLAPNDTKDHMALNRYTDFVVQEFSGQPVEDTPPPAGAVSAASSAAPASSGTPTGTDAAAKPSKDTAKAPKKPATTAPAPAASAH
jgi:OOP family OmpA-OmpF porin